MGLRRPSVEAEVKVVKRNKAVSTFLRQARSCQYVGRHVAEESRSSKKEEQSRNKYSKPSL